MAMSSIRITFASRTIDPSLDFSNWEGRLSYKKKVGKFGMIKSRIYGSQTIL